MWLEIVALLDALDDGAEQPAALLAGAGVRILAAAGWGLELTRCVRCGKACPHNARTLVDVSAGGVVCRTCGASGVMLSSAARAAMIAAMQGEPVACDPDPLLVLVERALEIHGRGEGT
jgi:DNA repair protein RecO (recombination protein O)